MLKKPLPRSEELLERVKIALTPDRLPLLIAIDGADGCGKSSLASWLAWQLGMPAIQLDLYLTCLEPVAWITKELGRVIAKRIDRNRPVIVDGVLILDALQQVHRNPDFLVYMAGEGSDMLRAQIQDYRKRRRLPSRADFEIEGYSPEGFQARPGG